MDDLACTCSERSHACAEGWGSVRRRDGDIQIVSNIEALRLQRHGVIRTLPARHGTADVFQPERWEMETFQTQDLTINLDFYESNRLCTDRDTNLYILLLGSGKTMAKLKWVPFFLASGYTSLTKPVSSFRVASILHQTNKQWL